MFLLDLALSYMYTDKLWVVRCFIVADLCLLCYERDFMLSLSGDKEAEIIEAFNSTTRHLGDLWYFDNTYSDGMVNQIYPTELQLN